MPLPKSIVCSSCKKTYPEGWKRCPYCGHDELRVRQDAIARKYMQRKVQEFEQKPPRPEARPQARRPQQEVEGRPGRGRRRRRRGARPPAQGQGTGAPPPPTTRPTPSPNPPRPEGGGGGKRRRFRRRRRGGRGGGSGGGGGES